MTGVQTCALPISPQPIRDGVLPSPDGRRGGDKFFLRKGFEPGNEFKICRGKSARGHDPDVICHGIHGCLRFFGCTLVVMVAIACLLAFYP